MNGYSKLGVPSPVPGALPSCKVQLYPVQTTEAAYLDFQEYLIETGVLI